MLPFLEDKYENKYEFKEVNRKMKIALSTIFNQLKEEKEIEKRFTTLENVAYEILKYSYPNLTREEYEVLLDYNENQYGFAELYELLSAGIESAFTRKDMAKKEHPYLAEKKAQEQVEE